MVLGGSYNKLVLAQHLDDLVESFFMSCYHGQTRTMKANYLVQLCPLAVPHPCLCASLWLCVCLCSSVYDLMSSTVAELYVLG